MSLANCEQMQESHELRVVDQGKVIVINYSDIENFHKGDSWLGCTVGFRAMQAASEVLSTESLLDRSNLYIVSAHPGQGVLDAIDCTTKCISKSRFSLTPAVADSAHCSRDMKFEWWVSDGRKTANIKLRSEFIPDSFYDLLDRIGTSDETAQDKATFSKMKTQLSNPLWQVTLQTAFIIEHLPNPLSIGEIPNA